MTVREDWMDDSDYEWAVKRDADKLACRADGNHHPEPYPCITEVTGDDTLTIMGFRCIACGYYGSN